MNCPSCKLVNPTSATRCDCGFDFLTRTMGNDAKPAKPIVQAIYKVVFVIWVILLLPWIPFVPLSAMVFDPGASIGAYVFFWTVLTYPIPVIIAAIFRKRRPVTVFLPFLNIGILGIFAATGK